MPYYLTAYATGGQTYGDYIEARNRAQAEALAIARRLGERIEFETKKPMVPNMLAREIRQKDWTAAAHSAAQLCFIGLASGALSVRECLSDTGLLHQLLHLAAGVYAEEPRELKRVEEYVRVTAREFEWRVPGWPCSFTGQPGVTVRIKDKIDKEATDGYAPTR